MIELEIPAWGYRLHWVFYHHRHGVLAPLSRCKAPPSIMEVLSSQGTGLVFHFGLVFRSRLIHKSLNARLNLWLKYRGNRKNENRGIRGFLVRSKSVHMCYKRPDPNRKGQKKGTTNRRLANPYAKVNATRRTDIIRHCTGMFLFHGLSIYSTVSLDNGTRWRCFQTNAPTARCAGLVWHTAYHRQPHCQGTFRGINAQTFLCPLLQK